MRLPNTFDGEMPESMTATPTPVPFGPLVVLDDDARGDAQRDSERGPRRRHGDVRAGERVARDRQDVGVVRQPVERCPGNLEGGRIDERVLRPDVEPATLQAPDGGAAGARDHAHDDALFVRSFPAIVPVLDGRVEARGLRALALPRHGGGRCRDREDQSQHGGESHDGATQLDHARWDSRVAANRPRVQPTR